MTNLRRFPNYEKASGRKINVILLALFCLFFLQNCNWFFYPEETSISILDSYGDYEGALKGVYSIIEEYMAFPGAFYPSRKGDDFYEGHSDYSLLYDDCELDNSVYSGGSPWKNIYKTIASANNIITQYNRNKNKEVSHLVGEAFFLRAYCYFRLVKAYGRVPLIDNTDVDYAVKLPSFQEEYEFIEADLFTAISLLPANRHNSRVKGVSVHRGTAKALLAELYLFWGGYPVNDELKYQLAASMAEEVIDSAEYFGFELERDFATLWERSGLFSNELVFSVYTTVRFPCAHALLDYMPLDSTTYPLSYYYDNLNLVTQNNFYNSYPKDYRRDITFINDIDYTLQTLIFDDNRIPIGVEYTDYSVYIDAIETESKCLKLGFRKFYYDMDEEVRTTIIFRENLIRNSISYYGLPRVVLYRYAHTLLTFAEASARSGNLNDKASECLNMIRRRANKVDLYSISKYDIQTGLSAAQFADSVVQERAWELAGEPEGRWFDQVRTGQAGENCFLAIPDDETYLNPNLLEE